MPLSVAAGINGRTPWSAASRAGHQRHQLFPYVTARWITARASTALVKASPVDIYVSHPFNIVTASTAGAGHNQGRKLWPGKWLPPVLPA